MCAVLEVARELREYRHPLPWKSVCLLGKALLICWYLRGMGVLEVDGFLGYPSLLNIRGNHLTRI